MKDVGDRIRNLLNEYVNDQGEIGLQVAAYLDGRLVIDTWAGLADESSRRPVDGETLFTTFSISKGITATCIHILADRGVIDYDTPIAHYWPEFGVGGKAEATIRHVLTHQAGIPLDSSKMDVAMMCNWEAVTRSTGALKAQWEPGTRIGYHALTYGWILGEVIRRVDGRPIPVFLQEEICKPLDIRDLYFGVSQSQENRVATLENAPELEDQLGYFDIPQTHPLYDTKSTFNRSDIQRAAIPGAGSIANARSIARHYAMLAGGGELDGVRILSKERIALATVPVHEDPAKADVRWWTSHSLGYTLGGGSGPMEGRLHAFGYEGVGTIGFADPDRKFAFAFLKNLLDLSPIDERSIVTKVCRAVEDVLGIAS